MMEKSRATPSRDRIMREVEDSLRRLQTDRIDVYQVHWPDPKVPMAETANAMRDLFEQGTIRAIGVSNFSVAQMDVFRKVAPIHVVQPPYNLFERADRARRASLLQEARHRDLRLWRAVPRAFVWPHAGRHQVHRR
jgi:aryl-alcohol dehydrogenase-like predicted oxidoreductase